MFIIMLKIKASLYEIDNSKINCSTIEESKYNGTDQLIHCTKF